LEGGITEKRKRPYVFPSSRDRGFGSIKPHDPDRVDREYGRKKKKKKRNRLTNSLSRKPPRIRKKRKGGEGRNTTRSTYLF